MMPWLTPLQRCWSWISYTFLDDLAKTRVVDCRASVLDATEVLDCGPTLRVSHPAAPTKRKDWSIPRHAELRIAMRYPCDREVHCMHNGTRATSIKGRARNVSRGGIGVVVGNKVEPGTLLLVEMVGKSDDATHTLPARVVHARPMPIRGWFLGCAFAQDLSEVEVKSLL